MKTINLVKKTVKRSVAGIVGLILMSTFVHAQAYEKILLPIHSYNTDIIAMVGPFDGVSDSPSSKWNIEAKILLEYLRGEVEENLELESWMISDEVFHVKSVLIENEKEEKLELKDWMINEQFWKVR